MVLKWSELNRVVDSAATFLRLVDEVKDEPLDFRGQGNAEWSLRSRLDRLLNRQKQRDGLEAETSLLDRFTQEARRFASDSDLEFFKQQTPRPTLIAFACHHGVPTRALDWTRSVGIAATFACLDQPAFDGAVWWYDSHAYEKWLAEHWDDLGVPWDGPPRPNRQRLWWPSCVNPAAKPFITKVYIRPFERMSAQQAHYTICSRFRQDHDAWFNTGVPTPRESQTLGVARGRWLIRASAKAEVLDVLKSCGLTPDALRFPFLDHIGSQVEREIFGCPCKEAAWADASS